MRSTNFMMEDSDWDSPESQIPKELRPFFNTSPQFSLPDTSYPKQQAFMKNLPNQAKSNTDIKKLLSFQKGTTNVGFKFQGGIILAVDSRASMGEFTASEAVMKFIFINERLLGTMAGGAADCLYWEENLGRIVRLYELKYGEQMPIASASKLFAGMLYGYRGRGFSIGSIVAGSDKSGTHLYYCDNDGNRIKGDVFTCGSGGTYAYGIVDSLRRWDMTLEEAAALGRKAIAEATYCDSGSGGVCNLIHIDQNGWHWINKGEDNNSMIWNRINTNQKV